MKALINTFNVVILGCCFWLVKEVNVFQLYFKFETCLRLTCCFVTDLVTLSLQEIHTGVFQTSFMSEKKIYILYNVSLWSNYLVSFKRLFKNIVNDFLNLILMTFNRKKVKVQLYCTPVDLDSVLLMTSELLCAADQTGKEASLRLFPLSPPSVHSHSSPELPLKGDVQHAAEHGLMISACSSGKKHLCYLCIIRVQPEWLNQSFLSLQSQTCQHRHQYYWTWG